MLSSGRNMMMHKVDQKQGKNNCKYKIATSYNELEFQNKKTKRETVKKLETITKRQLQIKHKTIGLKKNKQNQLY